MSTKINDGSMSLEMDGRVIATAELREHAVADGHGAWIVSCHPGRLFTRNRAITAMVLAERLAAGYGDDDLSWSAGARSWARIPAPLTCLDHQVTKSACAAASVYLRCTRPSSAAAWAERTCTCAGR
jgi:hypothetical protein